MSEAEALEFIMLASANAIASFALYVTFTTAYLTAAFFVGSRLTSFQLVAVSMLFLIASTSVAVSCLAQITAFEKAVSTYPTILNSLPLWTAFSWFPAMSLVMIAGLVSSFYFMFSTRREKNGAENT